MLESIGRASMARAASPPSPQPRSKSDRGSPGRTDRSSSSPAMRGGSWPTRARYQPTLASSAQVAGGVGSWWPATPIGLIVVHPGPRRRFRATGPSEGCQAAQRCRSRTWSGSTGRAAQIAQTRGVPPTPSFDLADTQLVPRSCRWAGPNALIVAKRAGPLRIAASLLHRPLRPSRAWPDKSRRARPEPANVDVTPDDSLELMASCRSGGLPFDAMVRGWEGPAPPDRGVTMPRYLSMIRVDEQNPPDMSASPEFPERMGGLFEEITKAGVMLDTAGLTPTSEGTRITRTAARSATRTGPSPRARKSSVVTPSSRPRTRPRPWSGPSGSCRSIRNTGP